MWFNSRRSERPHQGLTCTCIREKLRSLRGWYKAAAWLSSARAVGCWLKCQNERNPHPMLDIHWRLPPSLRKQYFCFLREGGGRRGRRQVSTALMPWATHILQWRITTRCKHASASQSLKFRLSSDCSLQLDCMKLELVVIADQHGRGEYVLGSCTN